MSAAILPFGRSRRSIPPPFNVDKTIAALQRRAPRLNADSLSFVDALAERRRVSDRERWRLADLADAVNLGARDRG